MVSDWWHKQHQNKCYDYSKRVRGMVVAIKSTKQYYCSLNNYTRGLAVSRLTELPPPADLIDQQSRLVNNEVLLRGQMGGFQTHSKNWF